MNEEYSKNSIISFILVITTALMPLGFIPRNVEASTNINTVIGGLSGVITQLPLCQDAIAGGIKSLFSKSSNVDSSQLSGELITDTVKTATYQMDGVPIILPEPVNTAIVNTDKKLKTVQNDIATTKNNDTCLQSIGRTIIKMLLQKITTDTIKWINGGMDGSPLFVQDPGQYFKDIAEYEILGIANELNDPTLYPFGEAFIQAQANSFKSKFANNARYSLNEMIRATNPESEFTAQTFSKDFSQGGWSAWDALTQNPANNPLGFSLMASNELAKRIENKTELAKGSLQQSGGYLGVEKCKKPTDVTKQEDIDAQNGVSGSRHCTGGFYFVTPGQMVAAAATKTINYPDNNLLKSEDLNDAVAAILDALLGKFSSSFMSEGGFAGLSGDGAPPEFTQGEDGTFVVNDNNTTTFSDSNRTGQDYSSFVIASSSFLSQNPNFNIRTDLNQSLIDEQRIYQDKITEQNKELKSTIARNTENDPTGKFTGNYGLIPTIFQLDYCIPGPHPGFESDSRNFLGTALSAIVPHDQNSVENIDKDTLIDSVATIVQYGLTLVLAAVFATAFSVIPVLGTVVGAVLGAIIGFVITLFNGDSPEEKVMSYYATLFKGFTGVVVAEQVLNHKSPAPGLHNFGPFSDAMTTILDRYIQIIYDVYDPGKMPTATKEAAGKYLQLKGYNQMFTNNEARIVSMKSIITRLGEIKSEIDTLNDELKTNTIKNTDGGIASDQQTQYKENLKPWISAFGRISQQMVTGDDIAVVDNTTKQIIDEKNYIYNDLLKGPNGCEKDLELMKGIDGSGLPKQVYVTKRMSYPGPLFYDYNEFGGGAELPDPYNSGYTNKMIENSYLSSLPPSFNKVNQIGPGFLSLVRWEGQINHLWCGDNFKQTKQSTAIGYRYSDGNYYDLHSPLCLQDLFDLTPYNATIGNIGSGEQGNLGPFEMMIGVY